MKTSAMAKTALYLVLLTLTACNSSEPDPALMATYVAETSAADRTVAAETEQATVLETETLPPPSATPEPTATPSLTPTPLPPRISVSVATNCRSGPDPTFLFQGVLDVGEQADVVAKTPEDDYWYIVNPDDPEGYCWLLGEYASIDGQTENLPVHTPEPTPTPQIGFDVWFHGFASCGSNQLAIFAIHNGGAVRLMSGRIGVYTIGSSKTLYGPIVDRHPFSETATETCPAGHGNELYPGEVNYIMTPLKSTPSETDAYAEFKLCTADYAGGDCITKIGYFYIP